MFAAKIDWKDPRFAKWNLSNLGELNQAQLDSFLDDDEVSNMLYILYADVNNILNSIESRYS